MIIDENVLRRKVTLEEFFEENDIEYKNLTEKDKLKLLKRIVSTCKVDKDFLEQQYADKKKITSEEFIKELQNIELRQVQAQSLIFRIYDLQKEYKKEKREETLQKIKTIFNKK